MGEMSNQIKSFVIGFALSNLCQTLVDAVVSPLITLILKIIHFDENYFNQYYSKLGELLRAVITFGIVYFGVTYFSKKSSTTTTTDGTTENNLTYDDTDSSAATCAGACCIKRKNRKEKKLLRAKNE